MIMMIMLLNRRAESLTEIQKRWPEINHLFEIMMIMLLNIQLTSQNIQLVKLLVSYYISSLNPIFVYERSNFCFS